MKGPIIQKIKIKVRVPLWAAIKFRIAGLYTKPIYKLPFEEYDAFKRGST